MFKRWINKVFSIKSDTLPDVHKSQWFSANEIQNYQEEHLRKIVAYAYKQIPYYRRLFDENKLRPRDIKRLEDLNKIPVLTRKQAIENYDSLINPALINFTHFSGATTGQRLKWVSSRPWAELFTATLWRGFSWAGLNPELRVGLLLFTCYRRNHKRVFDHSRGL